MHLITGLLLSTLLGRNKKKGAGKRLPSFPGILETVHVLPGRVRLRAPLIVKDRARGKLLENKLRGVESISAVEVSPVTGSILIRFEAESIQPELLFAVVVKLLGLEEELEKPRHSAVGREIRELGESVNRAVYDATGGVMDLWTAVPLLLVVLGVRGLATGGASGARSGWIPLWWAYMSLFPGGRGGRS